MVYDILNISGPMIVCISLYLSKYFNLGIKTVLVFILDSLISHLLSINYMIFLDLCVQFIC